MKHEQIDIERQMRLRLSNNYFMAFKYSTINLLYSRLFDEINEGTGFVRTHLELEMYG